MTRLSLDSCWAKIGRAREHTHALELLEESFLKRRPNQVTFDDETEPPWIIIRALVEPVPIKFSTVAGDLVHNLRSALDHLAWQVVLSEGGSPGRHTAYPLMFSESEFEERVRHPPQGRLSPLEGIDPEGEKWARIKRFQPYEGASDAGVAALGALARLSNRDKHRALLAGVSFVHDFDPMEVLHVAGFDTADVKTTFSGGDVMTHNTEIARFIPTTAGHMEMEGDFPFDITFTDADDPTDDEAVAASVGAFDRIRSEVVAVVRAFEPFFP